MIDYVASLIRTWVPVGVGFVVTLLATKFNFVVDDETKAQGIAFFTAILTGVYYAAVRLLEKKNPKFGWLLGLAKTPEYAAKK